MSKGTILVTGASGFVGAQVITLLLAEGYSVRAVARGAKVDLIKNAFAGKDVEVVEIKDIIKDDLTPFFSGVKAIIHSASPLAGRAPAAETIAMTVDGALNVLQSAVKAGITKVVLTSSWATVADPTLKQQFEGKTFDENSWEPVTVEELTEPSRHPLYVYLGAKTVAEKAVWKFAEENPSLDLATINPPFIYGPFIPGMTPASPADLGTDRFILGLIAGEAGRAPPPDLSPYFIDVRDVAKAHVAAISAPKVTSGPLVQKRFLVVGGTFTWKQAVEHLATARPELKDRLPNPALGGDLNPKTSKNDTSLAAKALGLTEYISWQQTITDTVDELISLQQKWAAKA